jgi:hypothetical protein
MNFVDTFLAREAIAVPALSEKRIMLIVDDEEYGLYLKAKYNSDLLEDRAFSAYEVLLDKSK